MAELNNLDKELALSGGDIKAEVIAALLIPEVDIDDISIKIKGQHKRAYRNEIDKIEFTNDGEVILNCHRDGLYHNLPQALFHSQHSVSTNERESETYSQLEKEERETALNFFTPFEREYYRARTLSKYNEFNFFHQTIYDLAASFSQAINIENKFSREEQIKLFTFIPTWKNITDDPLLISNVIEHVLHLSVESTISNAAYDYHLDQTVALGNNCILGQNIILGGSTNYTSVPVLTINLKFDNANKSIEFANLSSLKTKMLELVKLFIPLHFELEITHHVQNNSTAILGNDDCILGFFTLNN